MALNLEEHRLYLQDKPRIAAYRAAIAATVRPGQTVLDLASGTGILGLLACEAGAAHVYAIEESGLSNLARALAAANGYGGRFEAIKANAFRATLPRRVDLVITDQMGRFGFEAGVVQLLGDARQRFLKPQGVTIPSAIDLEIAPVKCRAIAARLEFWESSPAGLKYDRAVEVARNTGYPINYRGADLLGEAAVLTRLDLAAANHSFSGRVTMPIHTGGLLDGIGGWFTAQLSPAVVVTNSPLSACAINRRQVFFPLARAVPVEIGDLVEVEMQVLPANLIVAWRVNVIGRDRVSKGAFSHSTLRAMLLTRAGLRRLKADYVPRLNPWGEARRLVVNLCDGARPLAAIESEVHEGFPQLFASLEQAAEFVAEVVTRYGVISGRGGESAGATASTWCAPMAKGARRRYGAPRLIAYRGFAHLTPRLEPLGDLAVFGIAPQED